MSKTISAPLKAHLALGTTTLAWCWKATRRDGYVLAVTTCASSILFEGTIYQPRYGFNPKALSQEASGAVSNTEVESVLSSEITEDDIFAGLWDGCVVETFQVNYRDFSMGKINFGTKTMGDLKTGRSALNAELRGLTQSLQKVVGRVYTAGCPWVFGSIGSAYVPACNIALGPLTVTGAFTSVSDLRTMTDSSRGEVADYFGAGLLTITSGENAGVQMEIYSFAAGGQFVLHLPMPYTVAVGDTYSVTPGCRKRFTEDCRTKWNNTNNFGGFPQVPGSDKVLGLGGTEGTNL